MHHRDPAMQRPGSRAEYPTEKTTDLGHGLRLFATGDRGRGLVWLRPRAALRALGEARCPPASFLLPHPPAHRDEWQIAFNSWLVYMTINVNQFQPEASRMSLPSNGITPDVIREMMPPYHLSPDLLEATFAALPPPPPDASAAWRQARITRLMQEISTLMPANAAQARLAAEILIVREMADTVAARAYAPDLTVPQMCRVGRASGELVRTAAGLVRTLERSQQKPAPFFGTVLADDVDVAAVDKVWGNKSMQSLPPGTCPGGEDGDAPGGRGDPTDAPVPRGIAGSTPGTRARGHASGTIARGQGLPAMPMGENGDSPAAMEGERGDSPVVTEAESSDSPAVTEGESSDSPAATEGQSGDSPAAAVGRQESAGLGRDAGSTPEWTTSRLDKGPGWTLEVVRPRTGGEAGAGAAPGAGA
jgi:hypothetical protein